MSAFRAPAAIIPVAMVAAAIAGCGGHAAPKHSTARAAPYVPKTARACVFVSVIRNGTTLLQAGQACAGRFGGRAVAGALGYYCVIGSVYGGAEATAAYSQCSGEAMTDVGTDYATDFVYGAEDAFQVILKHGIAGLAGPGAKPTPPAAAPPAAATTNAAITPAQPSQPKRPRVLRRFTLPKADDHDPGGSCLETNGRYRWPSGSEAHAAFCGGHTNACYVYDPGRQAWQFVTDNAFDSPQPYHAACLSAGDAVSSGAYGD